jgi:hypothetical protein
MGTTIVDSDFEHPEMMNHDPLDLEDGHCEF